MSPYSSRMIETRHVSMARIAGNLLAEGMMTVSALMMTEDPFRLHAHAPRAFGFRVDDSADGDSARGHFHGRWPGVIRPTLEWRTRFEQVCGVQLS